METAAWDALKSASLPYPIQPFRDLSPSRCHWFDEAESRAFGNIVETIPADGLYLELGTFLGAGSLSIVMNRCPTVRAVCCDSWNVAEREVNRRGCVDHSRASFFDGHGTVLDHFFNNTFEWRDRIAPYRRWICPDLLHQLADLGCRPDMVLVDDDHDCQAVVDRLRVIAAIWPRAVVVLDDFVTEWNGVRQGFHKIIADGVYEQSRCTLIADRFMVIR